MKVVRPIAQFYYDNEPFPKQVVDEWREALICELEDAYDCEV